MFALPGRSERIARALMVIEAGERLAQSCAERQLALARGMGLDAPTRSFLREQVRQESLHASFFGAGVRLFGGAQLPHHAAASLAQYRKRIDHDLAQSALTASLIGMQCVFEALGECVLGAFDRSPSPKVKLFAEFRHRIAREEATHHAFGVRAVRMRLARADSDTEGESTRARAAADSYAALGEAILQSSLPLFADLGADCATCLEQYRLMVRTSIDKATLVSA